MIITCEKCSTRFNLDDSILKEGGTKVRCSLCKHIFLAYPAQTEGPVSAPDITPDDASQTTDSFDSATDPTTDEPEFGLPETEDIEQKDELELELEDSSLEMETDLFEADGNEDSEIGDFETDLSFDESESGLTLESDDRIEDSALSEVSIKLEEDTPESDLTFEEAEVKIEDSALELEASDSDDTFTDDTGDFEIDDDLSDSDTPLELEDSDFYIQDTALEMNTTELSLENSELNDSVDDFEADDDFSFQSDNFEIQSEDSDSDLELAGDDSDSLEPESLESDGLESDGLEIELADDDIQLADDEPVDGGFDFYAAPVEEIGEDPEDEIDDLEFEPIEDDDTSAISLDQDLDYHEGEPSLTLATDDADAVEDTQIEDEEEFELEFDYESTDDDEEDLNIPEPDEPAEDGEPPMVTPEDDFSEYDDVLAQETEPEDVLTEEDPIEIDDSLKSPPDQPQTEPTLAEKTAISEEPSRISRRRKQKKSGIGTPVLILVLLFILVAGAYVASIMTGYKIKYLSDVEIPYVKEYIEKYMPKKEPPVITAKPVLNQKSVNGKFVSNATAGNLFVITGRVENQSSISFSHIEIKGSLSTKEQLEAKAKIVFCGNLIPEEMLKTGKIEDIEKLLMVKEGKNDSNVKIRPGSSVPFMVVFSDYPEEKLENFVVRVHSFEKSE